MAQPVVGGRAVARSSGLEGMTVLSVVMPAHDEEALIAGAVRAIASAEIDLIVVVNGCTDATAERAREAGVPLRVIELSGASKIRALNAGSAAAHVSPVAFVDADVTIAGADLITLAQRLAADPEAEVAAPTMRVLPSTSWWVRQYYKIWELTEYRTKGHIGSGVYMLTRRGRERISQFPDIIADDLFVQQHFALGERLTPTDLTFSVRAPGTLASLVKRNTRIAAGNQQFAQMFPELTPPPTATGARVILTTVWRRPTLWLGFVVYAWVYAAAHRGARRLRQRRLHVDWNRDDTTRSAQ